MVNENALLKIHECKGRENTILPRLTQPVEVAKQSFNKFSSLSKFEDSIWVLDKVEPYKHLDNYKRTLKFSNWKLTKNNLVDLKLWIIYELVNERTLASTHSKARSIALFANDFCDGKNFSEVTRAEIQRFYQYLFYEKTDTTIHYRNGLWNCIKSFYRVMGYENQYIPFSEYSLEPYNKGPVKSIKYIPKEQTTQLDRILMNESIPVAFRGLYWTMRLYPNRITEVLSIKDNCIKRINDDTYMLTIPTFKERSSYAQFNPKLIEIKYTGFGKYYIDLMNQISNENKKHLKTTDFFFCSKQYVFEKNKSKGDKLFFREVPKPGNYPISQTRFLNLMKGIIEYYHVVGDDGNLISLGTHRFRYNAISDRLNSGIFRVIDVQNLTYHRDENIMIDSYTYTDPSDIRKDSPVVFRGHIINTDDQELESKLMKRPYAHRIYKLGICSDDRNCEANMAACLRCEYLFPDIDSLDYYKEERDAWKQKMGHAHALNNYDYEEHCRDWFESYQKLIDKVLRSLSYQDFSMED